MTNQTETPKKKTSITKKIFIVIGFVLAILGIDHFTYNFAGIGASVTVTDSTLAVVPIVDSIVAVDTTKADTTKK